MAVWTYILLGLEGRTSRTTPNLFYCLRTPRGSGARLLYPRLRGYFTDYNSVYSISICSRPHRVCDSYGSPTVQMSSMFCCWVWPQSYRTSFRGMYNDLVSSLHFLPSCTCRRLDFWYWREQRRYYLNIWIHASSYPFWRTLMPRRGGLCSNTNGAWHQARVKVSLENKRSRDSGDTLFVHEHFWLSKIHGISNLTYPISTSLWEFYCLMLRWIIHLRICVVRISGDRRGFGREWKKSKMPLPVQETR